MRLAVLVASSRSPWLDESLARLGFDVVFIDGTGNVEAHVGRALATHDDPDDDALVAAGRVEDIRTALDPQTTGNAALIAVHATSTDASAHAFRRLLLRVAEARGDSERGALLSEIVEEMRATPEIHRVAESHAFVAGAVEIAIGTQSGEGPVLATLLSLADEARDRESWNEALAGYRAALFVPGVGDARADVYARIGAAERALGHDHAATRAFEKYVHHARTRIDRLATASEKADEHFAIAQTLVEELCDLPSAVVDLEKAREIDGTREDVLEALRRAYKVLARRSELVCDEAVDEIPDDVDALEAAIAASPLDVALHARLFELHMRAEEIDRAYLSALALEELGWRGAEQQAVLEQNRPDGLRARKPLDEAAWARMRPPGGDDVIESLFAAIARAAIAARTEQRRLQRRLPRLDPTRKQSPTSTASIVRSFHWAARALTVTCPDLYVLDEVPGGIAAVPSDEPATALGPDVVRGRSTKDLAFLAGRHLTYYRPEHALLVHFPTRDGLTSLVLAAVQLAMPAMPVPLAIAPAVGALRPLLARHLTPQERATMEAAVRRLDARGGKLDLVAWTRSVELLATRAGLLLCGDLRCAMSLAREESRTIAGVTLDEKRADLLSFCASRALADLRVDFATTGASPSMAPPRSKLPTLRDDATLEWTPDHAPQSAAGG